MADVKPFSIGFLFDLLAVASNTIGTGPAVGWESFSLHRGLGLSEACIRAVLGVGDLLYIHQGACARRLHGSATTIGTASPNVVALVEENTDEKNRYCQIASCFFRGKL